MSTVLKRAVALFTISVAVVIVGYVLALRYMSCESIRERLLGQVDTTEPVTFVCQELSFGPSGIELLGWLVLYFFLCIAVAWCWTWIRQKIAAA